MHTIIWKNAYHYIEKCIPSYKEKGIPLYGKRHTIIIWKKADYFVLLDPLFCPFWATILPFLADYLPSASWPTILADFCLKPCIRGWKQKVLVSALDSHKWQKSCSRWSKLGRKIPSRHFVVQKSSFMLIRYKTVVSCLCALQQSVVRGSIVNKKCTHSWKRGNKRLKYQKILSIS